MRSLKLWTILTCICASLLACDKAAVNIEALSNSSGGGGGSSTAPVVSPITASNFRLSAGSAKTFSVTAVDAENDSLTYSWTLNGVTSAKLVGAATSATLFSDTALVGEAAISVAVSDGSHTTTHTWVGDVNHFNQSCNDILALGQTNKTCVFSGVASLGSGLNPQNDPTAFMLRPLDIFSTPGGDMFIADEGHAVVWFWNRSAADATTLGVSVPAGQMKVVAGVGHNLGSAATGTAEARRIALPFVSASVFDGTHLYIAMQASSTVIRVDSLGQVATVATNAQCGVPRGMVRSGNFLYVVCQTQHTVVRVDVTTLAAPVVVAGLGSAGDPTLSTSGSPTLAATGRLNFPYGLAVDGNGNLWISEATGCRIRMLNVGVTPVSLFGGLWTVGAGEMRVVVGAAGAPNCSRVNGEAVNLTATTDARINAPRGLSFTPDGNLVITEQSAAAVTVLNLSGFSATLFNQTIPAGEVVKIVGSGTFGYSGDGGPAIVAAYQAPYKAVSDPNTGDLYIVDYGSSRVRRVSSTNARSYLAIGSGKYRGQTTSNSVETVATERMSVARHLAYDSVNNIVYTADTGFQRIRATDKYGSTWNAVGTGFAGPGSEEDELPTAVSVNLPAGVALTHATATFGGHLVWSEAANHKIRIWNRSTTTQTLFGVTVLAGRIASIGGNGVSGNVTSGSALQSAFNSPSDLEWDSDAQVLYVSDTSNHCVKSIDASGSISVDAGVCGTSGMTVGTVATARMNSPDGLAYYSAGGNRVLFIADRANNRVRALNLTAASVILAGVMLSPGQLPYFAGGGTFHDENISPVLATLSLPTSLALTSSRLCFSNQTLHNVRCVHFSEGTVRTVMGPKQGVTTTLTFFSGTSLDSTSQNGVDAYEENGNGGLLINPYGLASMGGETLLLTEYYPGLIRLLKMTP